MNTRIFIGCFLVFCLALAARSETDWCIRIRHIGPEDAYIPAIFITTNGGWASERHFPDTAVYVSPLVFSNIITLIRDEQKTSHWGEAKPSVASEFGALDVRDLYLDGTPRSFAWRLSRNQAGIFFRKLLEKIGGEETAGKLGVEIRNLRELTQPSEG